MSSEIIVSEAKKLWLIINIINKHKNFFSISNWKKKHYFKANDCWIDSSLWIKIADDKELTYIIAEENNIKVPESIYLEKKDIKNFNYNDINLKFPLVTKPINWAHWSWVSLNIRSIEDLKSWIEYSFQNQKTTKIIIQEEIIWEDYRVIIVWWKYIACAKRIPPYIIWDWKKTIEELIEIENNKPDVSKEDHNWIRNKIVIDNETKKCIKEKWLNLKSILNLWKKISVRYNWNLSTWWISMDVTEIVNKDIINEAIKFSKILWLWLSWVDIITSDITKSLHDTKWAIIEINNTPWIKMHHFPNQWKSRNIAKEILNLLFKR